jgi:hypothetical protein
MDAAKIIRRKLKELEGELSLLSGLREHAKTDGGRMTPFGRELLVAAKEAGLKQSYVAKLLGITPGAVSQHYNK